ncbi:histamine H3 receptor [Rhinichthys klamathensis goyatoka]|uniref:histamine H3 receptor n=1 Tax=Rhinichthys klamathensis goyatoka TaxID=3034132 RepID=UPI0024B60369|nr:histamine H3 receptor [Rhinichthys klamathensis goyatoka]
MHNRLTEENGGNTMQSLLSVAHSPGIPTAVSFMWKSGNPQSSNWSGLERENATSLGDLDTFDNRRAQYGQFTPSTSIFLTVLMTLLVFATVLGNALVILAFVVEKSLRTQGNFFFLNLAIADFLVGGFCIPVYIPYVLTGEWRLGRGLCKLWLVVDYMLCTASVFNIVLISFDRFQSVTKAVSYHCQKGITREAVLKMLCVWLAAFLLYGPAIISWEHIAGGSVVPDGECYAEFYFNWYFLMTASTVEFFTPFISVTYFNLSIYINIRNRCAVREEQPTHIRLRSLKMRPLRAGDVQRVFFVRPVEESGAANLSSRSQCCRLASNAKVSAAEFANGRQTKRRDSTIADLPPLQVGDRLLPSSEAQFHYVDHSAGSHRHRPDMVASLSSRFRLSRDKKVAKSLAVIVCVFGLCWAPYTLLMIIRAACHGQCVQHYLYEISFWLLWINSSINPILYPLCHSSFKRAFSKLLCPSKIKIQPQNIDQKY